MLDNDGKIKEKRPLLVKLANAQEKWKILKAARNLSRAPGNMKNVSITLDFSEQQRDANRKLREELRIRRENGEDVVIYRGKVCPRANFE